MSSRHLWWGPPAPTFWDHCCEVVENLPHASRPSTSVNDDNIEKVKKIVAEALNISYGSTKHIVVHVLGMKRVTAGLVPKNLNHDNALYIPA